MGVLALQSGGSAVQDIIDKTVRVEGLAADVQKQLDDVNNRIKSEQAQKDSISQSQSKIGREMGQLEEEIKSLEGTFTGAEQDRADKDDQIRTLKEEIDHQSDMIMKLQKEKKSVTETKQKTEEDIQSMEDKCNHLGKIK